MHARIGNGKQGLAKSVVKGQEEELVTVSADAEKLVSHTGGQAGHGAKPCTVLWERPCTGFWDITGSSSHLLSASSLTLSHPL